MPIRAGDLIASTPGTLANLISDGQRLRVKWSPGDGDGNSSLHIIERSIGTKRGHPTWKVYCGDVESDKEDVPKYVYLDDKAAYDIWKSGSWAKQDMKKYWPLDFDAMGRIMGRRVSRGRPAVGEGGEYETGTLRDKSKLFVFKGGLDYVSARSKEDGGAREEGVVASLAIEKAGQVVVQPATRSNRVLTPEMAHDSTGVGTSTFPPNYPSNPYYPSPTLVEGSKSVPVISPSNIVGTTTEPGTAADGRSAGYMLGAKRKAEDGEEVVGAKNTNKSKAQR